MPRLRPFFSYFGTKHRAIERYPAPVVGRIVEPFAGSAAYATRYYWLPVHLYDTNPKVVGVWSYLTSVSEAEVRALPAVIECDTATLPVPQEAQWLIGWWLARGRAHPARNPSRGWAADASPGQIWSAQVRDSIAAAVGNIRHWRVRQSSYVDVPIVGADWFVDPPYQGRAGRQYRAHGSDHIDYAHLGGWCQTLPGQVIVCENLGAEWLPFRPLFSNAGLRGAKVEAVWLEPEEAQGVLL